MAFFQVDAQSHDGLTPLGFAAAAGHLNIVTMLCQHKAKVAESVSFFLSLIFFRPLWLYILSSKSFLTVFMIVFLYFP